jgi:hypothetical protein
MRGNNTVEEIVGLYFKLLEPLKWEPDYISWTFIKKLDELSDKIKQKMIEIDNNPDLLQINT